MQRPWKLWIAIVVLGSVLTFVFWAQFGYENTMVIYEEGEEIAESARAPQAFSAEESTTAPAAEAPLWFTSVRWSAIIVVIGLVIYALYLELSYRRSQRRY